MQKTAEEMKMEREIFDAIHSLVLLREERDIDFFLKNRRQQIDKIERSEFNPSRYTVRFKNSGQPFYRFDYALHENGRLVLSALDFKQIEFGKIRKVFSQIYFGFVNDPPPPDVPGRISRPSLLYMTFIKNIPQGVLCFSVRESDSLTADDYGDFQEGILREEKLSGLFVDSMSMRYGEVFKEYRFMDAPPYE